MLHLIPAPLHRAAYRAAHSARLLWWRLRRPVIRGCRIIAFDPAGQVLLVRHSYGSGRWMLPAGGLGRNEDPVAGARRELAEEVGCHLDPALLVLQLNEPLSGASNQVQVVAGRAAGQLRCDGREVIEAAFFEPGHWPSNLALSHQAGPGQPGLDGWVKAAAAAVPQRQQGQAPAPPHPPLPTG